MAGALAGGGVEVLFTLCGGHVLHVLDGCVDAGIRVIDTRHEQAAVLAAEGYALASRRPGVAAVTAGPGFTNAITGMADANLSGAPVVVLGGRTPLRSWNRDAIQDVDQLALARIVSKRARTCLEPARLAEHVRDALYHATAPRQGVAYLELPTDVLMAPWAEAQWSPGYPSEVAPPPAADDAIAAALEMLDGADRPVCVLGSGAHWAGADAAVARFAEATGIPVTSTGAARGLLPDRHPGCLGGLVHGGLAVVQADVVLLVGSRFDGNLLFGGPPLFHAQRIIQVDVRADAFGGNRIPDLAVQGDAAVVLEQLASGWTGGTKQAWLTEARAAAQASRDAWDADSSKPVRGVHPGALARAVDELVPHPRTLVADGGDILTWGIAHFEAERSGSILTTGTALGTLGVGPPFAIGAAAARPGEAVVCMAGDGAFGLSAMEVDTAARHGLPIVFVVSNNGAWGDVKHEQGLWFGAEREVAIDLGSPDYTRLADMVGGFGVRVRSDDELRPALEAALAAGTVAVVDVRTDPHVVSEILRGIGQLGVM